jgi:hypothetical protein
MPALPPERNGKAVHVWDSLERFLDSSIRFATPTQRMRRQKYKVQKILHKCRDRRRLPDPHGRHAGVSP